MLLHRTSTRNSTKESAYLPHLDAIIAVATDNGLVDLSDHDFKLMYSPREGKDDRIVARIVAIKAGVIKAKVEPDADGQDQTEAFKVLRKDVEVKLDRILSMVPDGSRNAEAEASSTAAVRSARVEAPPAYSGGATGVADRKGT